MRARRYQCSVGFPRSALVTRPVRLIGQAPCPHHGGRQDFESETFFVAPTLAGGGRKSGGYSLDDIPITAPALRAQAQSSPPADSEAFIVAGTLNANGKAAGSATQQDAESGLLVVHGTQDPDVRFEQAHTLGRNNGQENAILAFSCKDHGADAGDIAPTLRAMSHSGSHTNAGGQVAIAYPIQNATRGKAQNGLGIGETADPMYTLDQASQHAVMVAELSPTLRSGNMRNNSNPVTEADMLVGGSKVRRLIPRECERLQGMPDYTHDPMGWRRKLDTDETPQQCIADGMDVRQAKKSKAWYVRDADGPRYKAIGNSKAVPCVRWIGRRILNQLERR